MSDFDPRKILNAFFYSLAGLRAAFRTERAFRQEVIAAVILAPLGIWLGRNGVERAALVSSVLLVLIVELVNSAIESLADRVSRQRHPLAKKAKDIGSAAVFVALVLAAAVWLLVLTG